MQRHICGVILHNYRAVLNIILLNNILRLYCLFFNCTYFQDLRHKFKVKPFILFIMCAKIKLKMVDKTVNLP